MIEAAPKMDNRSQCSFCQKTHKKVDKLVSSPAQFPRAYICNECVEVCHQILQDTGPEAIQQEYVHDEGVDQTILDKPLIDQLASRIFRGHKTG
jgi:ATP-dependent protease Clp ATPase subunit